MKISIKFYFLLLNLLAITLSITNIFAQEENALSSYENWEVYYPPPNHSMPVKTTSFTKKRGKLPPSPLYSSSTDNNLETDSITDLFSRLLPILPALHIDTNKVETNQTKEFHYSLKIYSICNALEEKLKKTPAKEIESQIASLRNEKESSINKLLNYKFPYNLTHLKEFLKNLAEFPLSPKEDPQEQEIKSLQLFIQTQEQQIKKLQEELQEKDRQTRLQAQLIKQQQTYIQKQNQLLESYQLQQHNLTCLIFLKNQQLQSLQCNSNIFPEDLSAFSNPIFPDIKLEESDNFISHSSSFFGDDLK